MAIAYETTVCGNSVLCIDLTPHLIDCHVCGEPDFCRWGVPVWNGSIVANDWPGEWGGVSVCRDCFARHERGELVEHPTSAYRPDIDDAPYSPTS